LNELSYRLARLRKEKSQKAAALRARLPEELTGPASVQIRLKQVRASDLIDSLALEDGRVLEDTDEMLGEAVAYFGNLYTS
jgi:hypothetical protein